jgi:methionyl-tRNA formyltransferase
VSSSPRGDAGPTAPVRTVLFGSGPFAVPILEALSTSDAVDVVAVVTTPDRPAGRGGKTLPVPVATRSRDLGLPVVQPETLRSDAAVAELAAFRPRLAILADYGRLVPPAILAIPERGFLNLHPSLLPRHRGASPIPAAILAGDTETGVTLIEMDAGLDTGPIVATVRWPLAGVETSPEVEASAARRAADLLLESLPRWLAGRLPGRAQEERLATTTRLLRRADGWMDGTSTAMELERRVRAYAPWPGTFLQTPAGRVSVLRAQVTPAEDGDVPGVLVADRDGLALATVAGRLRLIEIQPAGGRPMPTAAWRRGRPGIEGSMVAPAGQEGS